MCMGGGRTILVMCMCMCMGGGRTILVEAEEERVKLRFVKAEPKPREPGAELAAREEPVARRVEGVEDVVRPEVAAAQQGTDRPHGRRVHEEVELVLRGARGEGRRVKGEGRGARGEGEGEGEGRGARVGARGEGWGEERGGPEACTCTWRLHMADAHELTSE